MLCLCYTLISYSKFFAHFSVQKIETQSYCKLILHPLSTFPTDSTKQDMEQNIFFFLYWQFKVLRQKTTIWLFFTLHFFFILFQLFEISYLKNIWSSDLSQMSSTFNFLGTTSFFSSIFMVLEIILFWHLWAKVVTYPSWLSKSFLEDYHYIIFEKNLHVYICLLCRMSIPISFIHDNSSVWDFQALNSRTCSEMLHVLGTWESWYLSYTGR